jgi:hypothetical protein
VAWIDSELKLIGERRAFLEQDALSAGSSNIDVYPPRTVPFYRLWLGDVTAQRIDVRTESDFERAELLFPESTIWFIPRDYKLQRPAPQP